MMYFLHTILSMMLVASVAIAAETPSANQSSSCDRLLATGECAGCDLRFAELTSVNLANAKLDGADLQGADLSRAVLYRASLRDADLRKASFRKANLRDAVFDQADRTGASFEDALGYAPVTTPNR